MTYEVRTLPEFERQAKRLVKKYPSLLHELQELGTRLSLAPEQGVPLGQNAFKIRLAIASKGRGKSGGARVITLVFHVARRVYLMAIYDKSETDSLSTSSIAALVQAALANEGLQ